MWFRVSAAHYGLGRRQHLLLCRRQDLGVRVSHQCGTLRPVKKTTRSGRASLSLLKRFKQTGSGQCACHATMLWQHACLAANRDISLCLGEAHVPDGFSNKPLSEMSADPVGQETADHMVRALQEYQQARFGPVHFEYLSIFRGRLQNALQSEVSPPLLLAKIEVELFSQQIEKLKSRMLDETVRAMTHWLAVAEKVGARSEIDALVNHSIDQFCRAIGSDALEVAESYADLLKAADAAWRQKYPEKAAQLQKSATQ